MPLLGSVALFLLLLVLLGVLTPFERRIARMAEAPPWWRWAAIRESARVSRAELARELNVDVATISRWERNRRKPRGPMLDRYLETLAAMERVGKSA